MPAALRPSFADTLTHWEAKFCCDRYPVKAVPIDTTNATAPLTHVIWRWPRHAAMKNLDQRWMTIKKKNSSTLHRCRLLRKCPILDTCHHDGPSRARRQPLAMTTIRAAVVNTPKTDRK